MNKTGNKKIKRLLCTVIAAAMLLPGKGLTASAEDYWPTGPAVVAPSAIVIEQSTGTVLYEKNSTEAHYPASITKILTGLLTVENSNMSDELTFSKESVYNTEGSGIARDVGEVMTVEQTLYGMMLASANECAYALAEHVSGSIGDFAKLMTEKAKELGCKNTNFKNPSGLNDDNHYTTAYDMALIGIECFNNKQFLEIESKDSHRLAPTKAVPNGLIVTVGHKMLRSGTKYSDDRVVGGKTGYTIKAGNTLVTLAEDNGRRIVAVCLKDKTPAHYTDTQTMLNFGLNGFENIVLTDVIASYNVEERLLSDKVIIEGGNKPEVYGEALVTLPNGADIKDIVARYDYNIDALAPENAVAKMVFTYADLNVGEVYITNERESVLGLELEEAKEENTTDRTVFRISVTAIVIGIIALLIFLVAGSTAFFSARNRREDKHDRRRFKQRQRERLKELGMSEEEFAEVMKSYKEKKNGK